MVKHSTVALVQSVIGLLAIITNASLQAYGLGELNKVSTSNAEINDAKNLLMGAILTQFIAAILMIVALVLLVIYRQKFQLYMDNFIYIALILSGLLLIVGGSMGSAVAMRLQCYRSDPHVQQAWATATYSAIIGIVGAIVMLTIQAFVKRDTIKDIAREYLIHESMRVPTHSLIKPKVQMPAYYPPGSD